MQTTIFVGNGLNISEGMSASWNDLLEEISTAEERETYKQFSNTFGYEFLECRALNSGKCQISKDFKKNISKSIREKIPHGKKNHDYDWSNTLQHELMHLPVDTFITTNYDYALELSANTKFNAQYVTRERLYSLKRKQIVDGKTVYHIHGELNHTDTICLGFEHYAGSLEKIRGTIVKSTSSMGGEHTFHLADVMKGLSEKEEDYWFYRFFSDDIYFIGFGLDESEIDIWWLLSYRYHVMQEGKLAIKNHICFIDTESLGKRNKKDYQAKLKLLQEYGVEISVISGRGYKKRYLNAIKYIESRCN